MARKSGIMRSGRADCRHRRASALHPLSQHEVDCISLSAASNARNGQARKSIADRGFSEVVCWNGSAREHAVAPGRISKSDRIDPERRKRFGIAAIKQGSDLGIVGDQCRW